MISPAVSDPLVSFLSDILDAGVEEVAPKIVVMQSRFVLHGNMDKMSDQTFGMAVGPRLGPVYASHWSSYIHRYNDIDEIVASHRRSPEHFVMHHLTYRRAQRMEPIFDSARPTEDKARSYVYFNAQTHLPPDQLHAILYRFNKNYRLTIGCKPDFTIWKVLQIMATRHNLLGLWEFCNLKPFYSLEYDLPNTASEIGYDHAGRAVFGSLMHAYTNNLSLGVQGQLGFRPDTSFFRVGGRYRAVEPGKPIQEYALDLATSGDYSFTWMRALEENFIFAFEAMGSDFPRLKRAQAVGYWKFQAPKDSHWLGDGLVRLHLTSNVEIGALAAMTFPDSKRKIGLGVSYGPARWQRKFSYTFFLDW